MTAEFEVVIVVATRPRGITGKGAVSDDELRERTPPPGLAWLAALLFAGALVASFILNPAFA
jgi:hypothetical protein